MSKVLSAIVSPVTNLISGITGRKAVDRAANQATSGNAAAQAELQPYMDTGKQANTAISNKLSSGALGGTFKPGDLTQDPGYKFRLSQGEQALDRKNAASGGFFSGAALKAAQEYGQGLADQTYNDAFNRWLKEQQNEYGMLSGQSSQGLGAANTYGGYAADSGRVLADSVIAKENLRNKTMNSMFGG